MSIEYLAILAVLMTNKSDRRYICSSMTLPNGHHVNLLLNWGAITYSTIGIVINPSPEHDSESISEGFAHLMQDTEEVPALQDLQKSIENVPIHLQDNHNIHKKAIINGFKGLISGKEKTIEAEELRKNYQVMIAEDIEYQHKINNELPSESHPIDDMHKQEFDFDQLIDEYNMACSDSISTSQSIPDLVSITTDEQSIPDLVSITTDPPILPTTPTSIQISKSGHRGDGRSMYINGMGPHTTIKVLRRLFKPFGMIKQIYKLSQSTAIIQFGKRQLTITF